MKFVGLSWVKATPQQTVRGAESAHMPPNALYGGPGGYVMPGTSAKLFLQYMDDEGVKSMNIIEEAKNANGWCKLSVSRVYDLKNHLREIENFDLQDLPEILKI